MKILVYTDVHGNKYALDALYLTNDYQNADLRIFLGDAFAMCPYPNECLKMIFDSGDVFLMGNHDSYCAYGLPAEEFKYFKADKREHQTYMRNKVSDIYKEKLKALSKGYFLDCDGIKFYFTHYAWESDRLVCDNPEKHEIPTEKTAELFKNIDADYIIYGHNHFSSELVCNGKTLICVGSLGMKYPGNYDIITIENGIVKIEKKTITFDVEKLKREMLEENYPRAIGYSKWFNE